MKLHVVLLLRTAIFGRSVPYINYHATNVHGWLLPKRHNSTEYADFGDLQSMVEHTNSTPTPTTPRTTTLTYYCFYSSLTGHISQTVVGINNANVTFISVDVVLCLWWRRLYITDYL
ncbi:hypothetical protein P9112_013868 [Eukaryota sp. TZLM1-RC]